LTSGATRVEHSLAGGVRVAHFEAWSPLRGANGTSLSPKVSVLCAEAGMTVLNPLSYGDLNPERRFALLLSLLRHDAVAATRHYRRREIHRGLPACSERALCWECEADVLQCIWQLGRAYDKAASRGSNEKLRTVVGSALAGTVGQTGGVAVGLLRTTLANAGKDARRLQATYAKRDAKPGTALHSRADFLPLRENPVLLEVALLVVQFAQSNTALPPTVLPYDKLAAALAERCREVGIDPADLDSVPALVRRALSIIEVVDGDWLHRNVTGPISERLTEFVAPDEETQLECEHGDWGDVTGRWGAA
jgi:hypothetical protein